MPKKMDRTEQFMTEIAMLSDKRLNGDIQHIQQALQKHPDSVHYQEVLQLYLKEKEKRKK